MSATIIKRRRDVRLALADSNPRTVPEIAARTGLPEYQVVDTLDNLERQGIVKRKPRGRGLALYRLTVGPLKREHTMKLSDHVETEHHGTIVLVRPLTDAAREWIDENVETEGWQWLGGAFACEPRCVDALLEGMEADLA